MSGFHYDGKPVTAAQAARILNRRQSEWMLVKAERQRERDKVLRERALIKVMLACMAMGAVIGGALGQAIGMLT
jgi:uncharacterized protein YcfJ